MITDERKPVFKCVDITFTALLTDVRMKMLILLFAFDLAMMILAINHQNKVFNELKKKITCYFLACTQD